MTKPVISLSMRVKIIDYDAEKELALSAWTRDKEAVCEAVDIFNGHKTFDMHSRFIDSSLLIVKHGNTLLTFDCNADNSDRLTHLHSVINYYKGRGLRAVIESAVASEEVLRLSV